MAEIFDIDKCPVCDGSGKINAGSMMKDNRTYEVTKQCARCHGFGRVGIKRPDEEYAE